MEPIITITIMDEKRKTHVFSLPDPTLTEHSFFTIKVEGFNWHGKYAEYLNDELDEEVMAINRWADLYLSIGLLDLFNDYELKNVSIIRQAFEELDEPKSLEELIWFMRYGDYYIYWDVENDYDLGRHIMKEEFGNKFSKHYGNYFDFARLGKDTREERNGVYVEDVYVEVWSWSTNYSLSFGGNEQYHS